MHEESVIPSNWKSTTIILLKVERNPKEARRYILATLTSINCKIFEHMTKKTNFLTGNKKMRNAHHKN